ncbi:unannotated protein [freshwater metagenome]|uniref:Cell shape-determining protein MreC n=1 Tax=freshwater metagenome TaxID=449393 RepID=A0A6J6VMQ6_9ZZZZ|nr:rod shape-determining protein MreC [Actinomycetota bacterium]MSV63897.1 cell shape-determining protein [Actinomycetota bacterium]MSW25921.1 cell shape-determining protein [Actinomycetota bacterium]MSW34213.1 cell shape-determining protein [Actinomycetota bacterium]MSX30775.1 cell shape-determining protein [Actinomycetota bacterium]
MRYGGDNRSRLLLVILIVTSLFLITLDLRGVAVMSGIRHGTQSALAPFQKAASTVFSPVGNFFSDVAHLGRTRTKMKSLEDDNAVLRDKLLQQKSLAIQLSQLKSTLDLAGTAGYEVVNAKVISQGSSASFTQTIIIDAGANAHLTRDMTVICGQGLVGVVKAVYPTTSLVMLASDPAFKIGVRVAGSQEIGILSGQGTNTGVLQLLDTQSSVKRGDVLLARGSQGDKPFVPGVPVGEILFVADSAGAVSQIAEVKYFAHLSALGVVAVVVKAPAADPRDSLVPKPPVPRPIPTVTIYATPSPSPSPSATAKK